MNKKAVLIVILLIIAFSFGIYTFLSTRGTSVAGLKIVSVPVASVFLNDKLLGKTPYEDRVVPGEYILKLIPEDTTTQSASWQGKVQLSPALLTYIKRELGTSELTSSGEILSLEKNSSNEAQVAVFSTPDAASILFDGQEKGATPFVVRNVLPGEHDVAVNSPGFIGRTVRVQALAGYTVSVNFQLALLQTDESKPNTSSVFPTGAKTEGVKTPRVKIKDTPTGFLRVRISPSTNATETAQVKPGETYTFLEEKEGWFKISYESGKEGWVSSRYAEKSE